jgi:hypothetical protein
MAFKGGFLIRPTETNTSAVANLYLQGKMAIQDRKDELNKQSLESLQNIYDSSTYAATGVQDFDSMMLGYGQSVKETARSYKDAFDKRDISFSQFNGLMARLSADSKLVSQYPVILKEQNKSIKDGITEGKLSSINAELPGFFKDQNASSQPFKNTYQIQNVGGNPLFIRNYEYAENGEVRTATQTASLSSIVNPNRTTYSKVNTDSDVKKFVDILGDRNVVGKYEQVQNLNGTIVYGKLNDQSQVGAIRDAVEQRVESYSNKDLVSIAYDELGFSNQTFSDYDETRLQKAAERRKGLYKDTEGKPIDFSYEDLSVKMSERGDFYLDEKSADIVRGYLRNKHYSAISVDYDEKFVTPPAPPKEPKPTKAEEIKAIPLVAGAYTRENLSNISQSQQKEYNKFMGEAVLSGTAALADTELERALSAGAATQSISLPGDVSESISESMQPSSFLGQKISSINSIASIKRGNEFNIVLIGPSKVGTRETSMGKGVTSKATSDVMMSESMSSLLSDAESRRLYTELWDKNDDFKARAERSGYSRNTSNTKEAIYTVLQGYNLVPKQ